MENNEQDSTQQVREFFNIGQPRIEDVGGVIIGDSGEVDPIAPQIIRTNGIRLRGMNGDIHPGTTASTFTVNFDNSWINNRYITLVDPYEVQIERIDSNRPIPPGEGIMTQIANANTSTYTTLTSTMLESFIGQLDNTANTGIGIYTPYSLKPEKEEEPYYNFLDNITLIRD